MEGRSSTLEPEGNAGTTDAIVEGVLLLPAMAGVIDTMGVNDALAIGTEAGLGVVTGEGVRNRLCDGSDDSMGLADRPVAITVGAVEGNSLP